MISGVAAYRRQRCEAGPVARVGVRAGVDEGRDDLRCLAEYRRPVQRREAAVARVPRA